MGFKEGSKGLGLGFGYEGETREGEISLFRTSMRGSKKL